MITKNNLVIVLAYNSKQFDYFVRCAREDGDKRPFVNGSAPHKLKGLRRIEEPLIVTGTFWDREDSVELYKEAINCLKK